MKIQTTLAFIVLTAMLPIAAFSDTATDLKAKIDERNNQIKQLEEEIREYNFAVEKAGSEAKTLQGTIKTLDLTQKKISTDLTLTERKVSKTNLTIEQISDEISDIKRSINQNKQAVSDLLNSTRETEDVSLVAIFLSGKNIRDVWADLDSMQQVRSEIGKKTVQLHLLSDDLSAKQKDLNGQKTELVSLAKDLAGKKQAINSTKQEKSLLLTQTKNQEQAYKKLVSDREAQKAKFERELYEFESQLNILVDPSKYPAGKPGILSWPLESVFITQKFGKTVGAEKLYVSGSHNGVDFRATVGTKVMAAGNGVIAGTGNTDAYPGCYSFGKWVMVKHPNGLSTIYGHLSAIVVATGQEVSAGDTLGYSGNTGYSTGPHLHLGLYATQGVRIEKYVNSIGCKQAIIPLADIKAYLDPLAYLPTI